MPLGTEVDLGPDHIVLDRDAVPLERGTTPSSFWPMSIVAKRPPVSELLLSTYPNGRPKSVNF